MFSHILVTGSRNRTNLIGRIFCFKNSQKFDWLTVTSIVICNKSCRSSVDQVCFGLKSPVIHFCTHGFCLCLRLLFACPFCGVVLFSPCNCRSWCLLNCQNSAAFFLHVVFWRFSSYFHVRCAQSVICLLACFFGFWYCMHN